MKILFSILLIGFIWSIEADIKCTTPLNRDGYCVKTDDCPPIKAILENPHRRRNDILLIKDSYCGKTKIGKKFYVNVCCDVDVISVGCALPEFPEGGTYTIEPKNDHQAGERVTKGTILSYQCGDSMIKPIPDSKTYCQENREWNYNIRCPVKETANRTTLLAIGGLSEQNIKSENVFDLDSRNWIEIKENIAEYLRSSVILLGNELMILGGASNVSSFDTVKSYSFETGRKTSLQSMKYERYGLSVVNINGYVYAIGGFDENKISVDKVEKWDPVSKRWSEVSSMSVSRGSSGVAVVDDEIFVVGGYTGSSYTPTPEKYLNLLEAYNPTTDKWRTCKSMGEKRQNPGVAAVDGYLYVVGGYDGVYSLKTVEKYNPKTDRWTTIVSTDYRSYGTGACYFMGHLIIAGGMNEAYQDVNYVQQYDPSVDQWLTDQSIKEILYGGVGSNSSADSERWKIIPPMNNTRSFFDLIEIPWNLARYILKRKDLE